MSPDALEPVHPVDAPPEPGDEAGRPGEPEVPRRDRAEERHPEVRRRGPGGDLPPGILLEVVRDEPVLCGDLEALVVAPHPAREAPRPLLRELAGGLPETPPAPAHPVGDRGGEGPEGEERRGRGQRARSGEEREAGAEGERDHGAHPHPAHHEREGVRPPDRSRRDGGRRPLEEPLPGSVDAAEGADDRVQVVP